MTVDPMKQPCPGRTCQAEPGEPCRASNGEQRAEPHSLRWLNGLDGPLHRCPAGACDDCHGSGWTPNPRVEGALLGQLVGELRSAEWAERHFGLSAHAHDVGGIVCAFLTPRLAAYAATMNAIADDIDEGSAHDGPCDLGCRELAAAAVRLRAEARRVSTAEVEPLDRLLADRNQLAAVISAAIPALHFLAAGTGDRPSGVLFPGESARRALGLLHDRVSGGAEQSP